MAFLPQSKVGIVPLNWKYTPEVKEVYLNGISKYGFKGIQISGDQAESQEFLSLMKKYQIETAEQYLDIHCDENGPVDSAEAHSTIIVKQAISAGVEMLVFAVDGTADRDHCAAHAHTGPHLSDAGYQRLADHISQYAAIAAASGVMSSFHQHGGTFIETPDETDLLMQKLDSALVGLCLDVGHWLVGGGDPIAAVKQYGSRVTHVHVKDVSESVLKKMQSQELPTMRVAVKDHKLFLPAGTGMLNLPELFGALDAVGFHGWLMSEQDTAWEPSELASGISIANIQHALRG